jgi:hypothetical protein
MATFVEDSIGRGYGGVGIGGDSGLGILGLAALLGRRDDRGDRDCHGDHLNSAVDGINHNINTSTLGVLNQMNQGFDNIGQVALMSKLGSIEGAIPLVGSQVELAVCEASATVNSNLTAGFAVTNKNINDAESRIGAALCGIEKTVLTTSALNLAAIKDAQYANTIATRDDGDKTRAKIDFYHDQDMQRKLTVAENALAEERNRGRIRESEVNITNTNTNTATAISQQAQGQQQLQVLAALVAEVRNLANDVQVVRQAQSNVNFGVQGASTQSNAASNNKVGT